MHGIASLAHCHRHFGSGGCTYYNLCDEDAPTYCYCRPQVYGSQGDEVDDRHCCCYIWLPRGASRCVVGKVGCHHTNREEEEEQSSSDYRLNDELLDELLLVVLGAS